MSSFELNKRHLRELLARLYPASYVFKSDSPAFEPPVLYVPSHHNTAAMLPIILDFHPDHPTEPNSGGAQTPSILQRDMFRAVESNAVELMCHIAVGSFYQSSWINLIFFDN
ncbi:hypothetical protein ALC62_09293 [Cyphomyrmex costatus]|uniref:Uncharacterized protein n=1 Tax=Cyphomyrmex costatus TaxID=456900 RepID=A0A151IFM1_9HYME|nr:hypothetical protein ALC62_09293 [Cyphomyrmex costatus]